MPPTPSSPLRRFFAPPPRKVVVLPDSRFFARIVPVAAGADAAGVAEQVELALEALAPFPLPQLYHGHCWRPGAAHALIFAAYRKRFPAEETDSWAEGEIVLPSLALLATDPAAAGVVRLLEQAEALTALRWEAADDLPAEVRIQALPAEASDADRAQARAAILAGWESAPVEEWTMPRFDDDADRRHLVFKAGDRTVTLSAGSFDALDVRDKEELTARRRAQLRDRVLWRTFLGAAAVVILCGVTELALIGGRSVLERRHREIAARAPAVDTVMKADALAQQIGRLASQRLLPLEMLDIVRAQRPGKTQLLSVRMESLYVLQATARTTAVTDIDAFRAALSQRAECEKVDIQDTQIRDGVANFTVVVKFKPAAVKPEGTQS